jgi:hypothetical protein
MPETMDHIILGCVYSREVWSFVLAKVHLFGIIQVLEEDVMEWWLRNRKLVDNQRRKGFDSLFFLVGWRLWKERNSRTFGQVRTNAAVLVTLIWEDADEWALAGYRRLKSLFARA